MLVVRHTIGEDELSSVVEPRSSPNGETLSVTLGPYQTEALQDFAGTFGITLEHAARIILSEYLERAGYFVEVVSYEVE